MTNVNRRTTLLAAFIAFILLLAMATFAWAEDNSATKITNDNVELGEALVLSENAKVGANITTAATTKVSTPTQAQIRDFLLNNKVAVNSDPVFAQEPNLSTPYSAGALDSATTNNALNTLNWIRYIAGIQSNVTIDSDYDQKCQTGSLVMALNKTLSHYPTQPEGLDQSLFDLGYEGTSNSNIASGLYSRPASSIIAYMSDSDMSNLASLGHRQWCLNPMMGKTGFGYVSYYSCMYSMDRSNTSAPQYEAIMWPANNTPTCIFARDDAWSFSASWIDTNDSTLSVELVRTTDGKTWHFTDPTIENNPNSDGYFHVSTSPYASFGGNNTLAFIPYTDGHAWLDRLYDQDAYTVKVSSTAKNKSYTYNVTFFNLFPADSITIKNNYTGALVGDTLSLPLSQSSTALFIACAYTGLPQSNSAQYFDGVNYYATVDSNEYPTSWTSSDPNVIEVKYGHDAGFSYDTHCDLLVRSTGECTVTAKRGDWSKSIKVKVTDNSISSGGSGNTGSNTGTNTGNTGNSNGSTTGGNQSGATNGNDQSNSTTVTQKPTQTPAVTGSWKKSGGKWWFSYDSKSKTAQKKSYPANEWVTIKGKRYHFDSKGYMSSKWYKSGSSWYWLGTDGAMKTGWQKVSGKWYYLNPADGKMATGWKTISNTRYYLAGSGVMKTGWLKQGNDWYYLASSGAMKTGWQKVSGKWYLLSSDGKMKTGWQKVSNTWYYLNSSGAMKTGWIKDANKWYYLSGSGAMQKSKWISGKYWVDSNGVMATNAWVGTDSNHLYFVDSNGKWVKGKRR